MKDLLLKSGIGISLCFMALTGCAGKETTADLMREDATEDQAQVERKKQIAKDWEEGKELVAVGENRVEEGEDRVESAEKQLESGQDDIQQGEQEIAEGEKLVRESERKFREDYPEVDLN